jgi:hypothetical protein
MRPGAGTTRRAKYLMSSTVSALSWENEISR